MKSWWALAAIGLAVDGLSAVAWAQTAQPVFRAAGVDGVVVGHSGASNSAIANGDAVEPGETVETRAGANVRLEIPSQLSLTLGPGGSVLYHSAVDRQVRLKLASGDLEAKVGAASDLRLNIGTLRVRAMDATVAGRMRSDEETICLLEGKAQVQSPDGEKELNTAGQCLSRRGNTEQVRGPGVPRTISVATAPVVASTPTRPAVPAAPVRIGSAVEAEVPAYTGPGSSLPPPRPAVATAAPVPVLPSPGVAPLPTASAPSSPQPIPLPADPPPQRVSPSIAAAAPAAPAVVAPAAPAVVAPAAPAIAATAVPAVAAPVAAPPSGATKPPSVVTTVPPLPVEPPSKFDPRGMPSTVTPDPPPVVTQAVPVAAAPPVPVVPPPPAAPARPILVTPSTPAAPARPAEVASLEVPGQSTGWTAVVASMATRDNAQHEADRLKTLGLPADVFVFEKDGAPVYRVGVGRFRSYEATAEYLARVKKQMPDLKPWISAYGSAPP